MLAKIILPSEMTKYFDLVKVRTDEYAQEQRLHLYLDEKDITPEGHADLSPNGFYENEKRSVSLRTYPDFGLLYLIIYKNL